jgi:DNA-binding Lrp family transcriptional regulator
MPRKPSKTSRLRVQGAETRVQCFQLRLAGASFADIGKKLGISAQAAHQHVTKYLQETAAKTAEIAEDVRTLEVQRCDRLLLGLWPAASKGNPQAVEKALKVMERRAKLLGLDAPTKVAPTNPDGTEAFRPMSDAELDARIRELAEKVGLPDGSG